MSIISGYKKFKKHIKTNEGFQLQSLWTNANTVEADDKRTMQTKVGAINGISSSETANSGEIAASTALTNKMNGSINQLSRDLKFPDGVGFYPDVQGGVRGYNTDPERGADTFCPFNDGAYSFWKNTGYVNPGVKATVYTCAGFDVDGNTITVIHSGKYLLAAHGGTTNGKYGAMIQYFHNDTSTMMINSLNSVKEGYYREMQLSAGDKIYISNKDTPAQYQVEALLCKIS